MCYAQVISVILLLAYSKVTETQVCNQLGTTITIRETDHQLRDGSCVCHPHVVGQYCSACAPGYYGLWSGSGCLPCAHHCNLESTLATLNTLPQCNTLGRCLCKQGYYGARCEEKIPSLESTCEHCKPNCYKKRNECRKCGDCYKLVQEKFDEYIYLKNNSVVEDNQQDRYKNLEDKIKDLLSKINDSPNVELDDKIKKYYENLNILKRELNELKDNSKLSQELDEKMDLFDKNLDTINKMKEDFRNQLQNLAGAPENADLAKIVNEIINAKDKAINHADDIDKITEETNRTCSETCKKYNEIDQSLKNNKKVTHELQQKLLDWETLKNTSKELLIELNEICNKLSDLKIPEMNTDQSEEEIKNLDEKLKLYQQTDKLLSQIKDTNIEKILNTKKELENTIQDFDKFYDGKQKELNDLTSLLDRLKNAKANAKEVEERLQRLQTIIRIYFEKNKDLIASLKIFLELDVGDDELTSIEREIEFLTQECDHIIKVALNLQTQLNKTKMNLSQKFKEFQKIIREYEKKWEEDKKIYLDVIDIYDFILREIANEESLNAIEEDINEADELLKVTHEERILDVHLQHLKNVRNELDKLVVSAAEICGTKTGDSES